MTSRLEWRCSPDSKDIRVAMRKDLGSEDQEVESVWVDIRNNEGQKTLVGIDYRPHNNKLYWTEQ